MKRFFVEHIGEKEKIVLMTGRELHHLRDVLRLKKSDKVILFDGKGREFIGIIEAVSKDEARIVIEKKFDASNKESRFEITLAQGIARGEKMDIIIQKATELGVSRIIPFVASRVVPKLSGGEYIAKKTKRWQRIALEAAKQCRRDVVPQIEESMSFAEVLSRYSHGAEKYIKIIPWEGEEKNKLKDILNVEDSSGCVVLIGPEGGFSGDEVVEAKKAGFLPVTLGPRILRTETAAISIVAIIQYELGDIGK
ncbi:MAG: 16S rRNA (uracil(1498)-N(3))-methyltransferase [Deltaproteobacteria bacterium]|nr:16S rRNA (uracil(1498)-N(3))-methyltransferase [Deltaproteobacteria bacterium]